MLNIAKSKVMAVDNTPINVTNFLIEHVEGYVYLGHHYNLKEKNQDKEIQRRIMAGWAAYAKNPDIFKSNLAICLKSQICNDCVLRGTYTCMDTHQTTTSQQREVLYTEKKWKEVCSTSESE